MERIAKPAERGPALPVCLVIEDKDGAAESSRRAADFVENDPFKDRIGTPEIIEGELWILREAPVTA